MKNKRPLIFITNDDSFHSNGIRELIDLMKEIGDVLVVAPNAQRSGQSHAITVSEPIRYHKVREEEGYRAYISNGTPVDCVKIAFNMLLKDIRPDILVSGINHGSNASINTIYSGTMAAVFEGCAEGVPSIGFSIDDHSSNADFTYTKPIIRDLVMDVLENGLEKGICLNVNFPKNETLGTKICHQAKAYWNEDFIERKDPSGGNYYWLTGVYKCLEDSPDADFNALNQGYTTITPMQVDFTAYRMIEKYSKRFNKLNSQSNVG